MTLLLTRSQVNALITYPECIAAVENVFRAQSEGLTIPSSVLGTHVTNGGFHIKSAGLAASRIYYAVKINANFPGNAAKHGLPTVQGVLALFDCSNGRLLALIDSIEITAMRTAAASAVAAKYLARENADDILIVGCGVQGRSHLRAISHVRTLSRAFAFDADSSLAASYASEMSRELDLEVIAVTDYRDTLRTSPLIVTCTPSREPLIFLGDIAPGSFVAAVGADNESKQEIDPALLAESKVVVDVLDQCAAFGDLHHAIVARAMNRTDVFAELADIVGGRRDGRASEDEIIIFDSTGTALEDVAAASLVYEQAISRNIGLEIELSA